MNIKSSSHHIHVAVSCITASPTASFVKALLTPVIRGKTRKKTYVSVSAARFRCSDSVGVGTDGLLCGFPGSRLPRFLLSSLDIRSSSSSHDYISFLGSPCLEFAREKDQQTIIVHDTLQSRDASQH